MPELPFPVVAVVLGLVEGLTEFLPISSTGHLIVAGHLLGYTGEKAAAFEVFIQFGAILAVVWLYRGALGAAALGLPRARGPSRRLALNLLLGFAPVGVLGLFFHRLIESHLFNPATVGASLMAGGIVIWIIERARPRGRVTAIEAIPATLALGVGLAQGLSLIPGVSRAAATILGGMLLGLDRRTATVFSFYLAIPTMLAASTFDLVKVWSRLATADLAGFVVGFAVSFLAGLSGVWLLLRYVERHDFTPFAYYRVLLGAVTLLYFPPGRP